MLPVIKTFTKRASDDAQFTFQNYATSDQHVNERSVVSLALKEAHSVAVDVSLGTLKAFIAPFAKALNFVEIPILNSQTSQTSYMNNFKVGQRLNVEYTPLQVDHQSDTLHLETNSYSFEKQILNDLQNNLLSLETRNLCETAEFDDEDQMGGSEGLAEMLVDLPLEDKFSVDFSEHEGDLLGETNLIDEEALLSQEVNEEDDLQDEDSNLENAEAFVDVTDFLLKKQPQGCCKVVHSSQTESESAKQWEINDSIPVENISKSLKNSQIFTNDEHKSSETPSNIEDDLACPENATNDSSEDEEDPNFKTVAENAEASAVDEVVDVTNFLLKNQLQEVCKDVHSPETERESDARRCRIVAVKSCEINDIPVESISKSHKNLPYLANDPQKPSEMSSSIEDDLGCLENTTNDSSQAGKDPNLKTVAENADASAVGEAVDMTDFLLKNQPQEVCKDVNSPETESESDARRTFAVKPCETNDIPVENINKLQKNSPILTKDEQKSSEISSSIFDSVSSGSTFVMDDSYDNRLEKNSLTFALEAPKTDMLNNVPKIDHLGCPENATNDSSEEQLFQSANSTFLANVKDDNPCEWSLQVQVDETDKEFDLELVKHHTSSPTESLKSLAQDVELNHMLKVQDIYVPTDELLGDSPITMEFGDARIQPLASLITDHVLDQGFENSDLVVFPELARDPYVAKLVNKLKMLYSELFSQVQTSEQRNDYRLSLANCVLTVLSKDERFSYDGISDDYLAVSNKLFSISEYVSEVLDYFFAAIDNDGFGVFSRDLSDESIAKSTPGKKLSPSAAEGDSPILDNTVTTFKKDFTSESEILWISISPSVSQPATTPRTQRRVLNVDDIPLRPPPDLSCRSNCSPEKYFRSLSPIREEPRVNLFDSHLSPSHDIRSDSSVTESSSSKSSPEVNIVISNEVNFFRTNSNASRFAQRRSVVFTTDVIVINGEEDKENIAPNNSGDWMGFEKAKF